jgi:hypothetical protein
MPGVGVKPLLVAFWVQVVVLLLKPPHGGFRNGTVVT